MEIVVLDGNMFAEDGANSIVVRLATVNVELLAGIQIYHQGRLSEAARNLEQVLELGRAHGEVVQDEIELEHDIQLVQRLQVFFGNQFVIEVVIDDGKAAIQVAVENGWQDVEQGEYILELRHLEHVDYVSKVAANAVRVGIKHDAFWQPVFHYYVSGMHNTRSIAGMEFLRLPARQIGRPSAVNKPYILVGKQGLWKLPGCNGAGKAP